MRNDTHSACCCVLLRTAAAAAAVLGPEAWSPPDHQQQQQQQQQIWQLCYHFSIMLLMDGMVVEGCCNLRVWGYFPLCC
jgi:hypothetical protein